MTNIIIHFRYNILTNNNQKYDIRIIRILYDIKQLAHKYKNCYFVSNYNFKKNSQEYILKSSSKLKWSFYTLCKTYEKMKGIF